MATRDETICDAIVTDLTAAAFSAPYASITPTRENLVDRELDEMATLVVTVVTRAKRAQRGDGRSLWNEEYDITVLLQKKLDQTARETQLDQLKKLSEEIEDRLKTAGRMGDAPLKGVSRAPLWDPEKMQEARQFESQITATYVAEHEPT